MLSIYFGGIQTGYNRTLGWAWDFNYWLLVAKPIVWFIFLVGYGIVALLKYGTNKKLSTSHMIILTLSFIVEQILAINVQLILLLYLISFIIFSLNFAWAIKNRNGNSTKRYHNTTGT